MRKTFGDYLIIFISIIAALATMIAFYANFFSDLNDQGKYGVLFLGILAIWLFFSNLYLIQKYRKEAGYAKVFEELNSGFMSLHSLDRNNYGETDGKIIKDGLRSMCNHISSAFKEVKGHQISVCVKLLASGKDNRAKVITPFRDKKSSEKRPVGDIDTTDHWITENSDFQFIQENIESVSDKCYYINNSLPYSFDYTNTRLKEKSNWPPSKIPVLGIMLRFFAWPLDYRSTIVVPIVPLSINDRSQDKLRGFLCIDSPRLFTFNEQYDVEILKGISDGLYNKIDTLQQILDTED